MLEIISLWAIIMRKWRLSFSKWRRPERLRRPRPRARSSSRHRLQTLRFKLTSPSLLGGTFPGVALTKEVGVKAGAKRMVMRDRWMAGRFRIWQRIGPWQVCTVSATSKTFKLKGRGRFSRLNRRQMVMLSHARDKRRRNVSILSKRMVTKLAKREDQWQWTRLKRRHRSKRLSSASGSSSGKRYEHILLITPIL